MPQKLQKPLGIKALDAEGKGLAVIATLNVVDKDGDITLAGAFGTGQEAKIVPAHDWSHVPLGKASIFEQGEEVLADFKLNLDIPAAKAWHSALMFDLKEGEPLQEWSYGFTITDSEQSVHGTDTRVRLLKGLKVHEISPVMLGAGENTRTVAIKSGKHSGTLATHLEEVIKEVEEVVLRCEEVKALRVEDGRDLSSVRRAELQEIQYALDSLKSISDQLGKVLSAPSDDTVEAEQLLSKFTVVRNRI